MWSGKSISLRDGLAVTLEEMQQAREMRTTRQKALLAVHGKTVVSLVLVLPGDIQCSTGARFLFDTAEVFSTYQREAGWLLHARKVLYTLTGPEAQLVIEAPAGEVKKAVVGFENTHPLGGWWDFDVFCPEYGELSRSFIGEVARRCPICAGEVYVCGCTRSHPVEGVLAMIEAQLKAFGQAV